MDIKHAAISSQGGYNAFYVQQCRVYSLTDCMHIPMQILSMQPSFSGGHKGTGRWPFLVLKPQNHVTHPMALHCVGAHPLGSLLGFSTQT